MVREPFARSMDARRVQVSWVDDAQREPIKLYLDRAAEPFKIAMPPLRFSFSTMSLRRRSP